MNLTSFWKNTDTRLQVLVGGCIWLFTLIVYCMTMAPTFSFWDCGEFIAVSHILGIPHPPGTPLFVIIGRLFSLLPLFTDIAVRINFLSALTSSLAVLFGYLTAVRLLRHWFNATEDMTSRWLIHAGAACGALFMAFGFTVWNNAVEAEVYGMTTLIMMAMIWLSIIYIEQKGTANSEKLMLLVFFLAFLGTGVHMTSFLVLPVVGLLFVIKHPTPSRIWYAIAIYLVFEIFLIFVLSARMSELPFYLPATLIGVCYLFYFFSQDEITTSLAVPLVGFVVVSLPAIVAGLANLGLLSDTATSSEGGLLPALNTVAMIALGGLLIYATWLLSRWMGERKNSETADATHLIPALFVIAALFLTVLLFVPKGYEAFLLLTLVATIALAVVVRRYVSWTLLVALIAGATLILGVKEFAYSSLAAAIILLILGLGFKQQGWKTGLVIIGLAFVGFSINGYSYIRSKQDPAINQAEPGASLTSLIDFIERKQYGSESMTERMFARRAEWENQFGDYRRMGFWGFFQDQYGLKGSRFILLFLFGMFAIWELIRRTPVNGLPFFLILLIGSVGLILYMNFADGTRINPSTGADYLEVRDRDYFFTPAFVMFGLAIGMGISLVIATVLQAMQKADGVLKKAAFTVLSLLFLLPGFALTANYHDSDRSQNYIPWDYGYNLLSSCEPNGIVFTNGDNDTFPLWCLQEVYGIRPDVAVVNLSLANSHWYIKQVQRTLKVNLGITPEQIDDLRPGQLPNGVVLRNYDHVINAIYLFNRNQRPIYFSVTVGSDVRKIFGQPIDSMIQLEGMMWRVVDPGPVYRVNVPYSYSFFSDTSRFRTRGVSDTIVYKDENTIRMVRNYANGFLMVADSLMKAKEIDSSFAIAQLAVEKVPYSIDAISFIGKLYKETDQLGELRALIDTTTFGDRFYLSTILANLYVKRRQVDKAIQVLRQVLNADPNYRPAFDGLVRLYGQTAQLTNAMQLIEGWLQRNPNDQQVRSLLNALKEGGMDKNTPPPPAGSNGE